MKKVMKNNKTNGEIARTLQRIPSRIVKESKLPAETIKNLALLWIAVLPLPREKKYRALPFLISIWIIITDRFYESPKMPLSDLSIFQKATKKILSGQSNEYEISMRQKSFRVSLEVFQKIYILFLKNNPSERLLRLWKNAINDFLKAMAAERSFSANRPPTFAQYIKNGKKSIGSSVVFYSLCALMFSGKSSLSFQESDIIKKIVGRLSLILRLVNDIGSFKRERQKNTPNGLIFLMKKGYSLQAAQNIFQRRIRYQMGVLKTQEKAVIKKIKPFFNATNRLLKFTLRFYERNDYHS